MKTTTHIFPKTRGARRAFALLVIIGVLGATAPDALAVDPTLTEMLELGIYSEETKGDLDAAMKLYEQIVAEADASQELAAQALFRLAMCHHKQGDFDAATSAFEKLVTKFPKQTELVSLANEYLAAGATLLPVPWTDREELQYNVRFPTGVKLGAGRYSVEAGEKDGRKIWRFQSQLFAGVQQWSSVEVDAATFKPMHCRWKHTAIGKSETVYSTTGAEVTVQGTDEVKHVDLEGPVYDNEQAIQLMRRLPLADGYATTVTVLSGLGGGVVIPIPLKATGPVTVSVPAGEFECYKATLKVGPSEQIFWYSSDSHRYLVKFEAGGVIVELTRIVRTTSGEPVRYEDKAFDFALTAPEGWMFDRQQKDDATDETDLLLLDPQGVAVTKVSVDALEKIDASATESLRTWVEHKIAKGRQQSKRVDVREDSWRDLTLAGQPAMSFVADIEQGPTPSVVCGVYAFVDGNAVELFCMTSPEDFDAFRPKFDSVVASYQSR